MAVLFAFLAAVCAGVMECERFPSCLSLVGVLVLVILVVVLYDRRNRSRQ